MSQNVGEYIAALLEQEGLDKMFILTGGDHFLWIALDDRGISPLLARSEFSAIYMADGYAQRSGKIGVSYGQGGPGAANAASALADPMWSMTPLITLNGSTPEKDKFRHQYQDLDTEPMLEAVTAATFRISAASQITLVLPRAIAIARQSGPVNISIPRDLFGKDVGPVTWPVVIPDGGGLAAPDPHSIQAAVAAITGMRRPLILAGAGAKRADIGAAVIELAEALGAPIATSAGGKGTVPETGEYALGVIGRYSSTVSTLVAAEADGMIVLGSRLGGLVTDGYRLPTDGSKVVHLDRDARSLAVHPGPGVRVQTDLHSGVAALLTGLADHEPAAETLEWRQSVTDRRRAWRQHIAEMPIYGTDGALRPHALFAEVSAHADDITVVADTGYMAAWTCSLFDAKDSHGYYRANGSLGWAYPAALGVQSADLDRRVVCISGDGGIGYHMGDFETAYRLGLPVIVIVLNNHGLAFEYHGQKIKYGNRIVPAVNDLTDLDHSGVARSFGWQGERVRTLEEFTAQFKQALSDTSTPWMIDVVVDREDFAPITNYDSVLEREI